MYKQSLKSLVSAIAEILEGNRQILWSSGNPGPQQSLILVGVDIGLQVKFDVAGITYYENISFKRQIRFSRNPLKRVG